jgi:transposase
MDVKTILNRIEKYKGFVYKSVESVDTGGSWLLVAHLQERRNSRGKCSKCGRKCPGYDRLEERVWDHVPLWGIPVLFTYSPRRVDCSKHGAVVEVMPWSNGKETMTVTYGWFLASWAKRLDWAGVGQVFGVGWHRVFRAVAHAVEWGLAHRNLDDIEAIGIDEICWPKGQKYLTIVNQLDRGLCRLLWIGAGRTKETIEGFFDDFGEERTNRLKFICTDMWQSFIDVVKRRAKNAVNILDRYHIAAKLGDAVTAIRAQEVKDLKAAGAEPVLKKSRWILLKRREKRSDQEKTRLRDLLRLNLKTTRANLLREDFDFFWGYKSEHWARRFLKKWTTRAMRSRLEPMKKVAATIRAHEELLLNWIRAKGAAICLGGTEGMNNKARVTIQRAYGFRTYSAIEVALYHTLGKLPEPTGGHRYT